MKDHYTFDFLELLDEHSEHDLEQTLVKSIRNFLIEMGAWFTFVGNQFKIKVGEKEYFIDLLLFHRKLRRLFVILSQLSISNKFYLMESLWDDLSRDETSIESPDWHKDILMNRKKALANGKAIVSDLEEAKIRIRNNILEKYLW